MSRVQLVQVESLENPSPVEKPLLFHITLKCPDTLPFDLEWRVLYVGSPDSSRYDQELERISVGPVQQGCLCFTLSANPPNLSLIPEKYRLGATAIILTCSYREAEFLRIGYFVNNELFQDASIVRDILMSEPRITHYPIKWD